MIKKCCKVVLSLMTALLVLSGFSYFYYNTGTPVLSESGASDYHYDPHTVIAGATEGYSFVVTDENGYNNVETYDDIDWLVLGSSHTQGFNVMQKENYVYLLNQKSEANFYNIGISAHNFLTCIANLENAIDEFQPEKGIIIEIAKLDFSEEEYHSAVTGEIGSLYRSTSKLKKLLGNLKYIKLLKIQLDDLFSSPEKSNVVSAAAETGTNDLEHSYQEVLDYISKVAKDRRVIIIYHETLTLNRDKTAVYDASYAEAFARISEQYDTIQFVNTMPFFIESYEKNHVLPHGFNNTGIEYGHLNRYGHEVFSDLLIKETEGETNEFYQ